MARPFPSIRKPSAGWTGAVNYTLEDHLASPYPHPIYPRKDGVLHNDSITRHMLDAGAHRKYFLSTSELIFTKAEYESSKELNGATITDPTTRESRLYQYLVTAPALAAILADYNASGGLGYESLVKEILGAPGSHTYKMCTADDDIKAPSIGLFVDLFDKFNAVVGILPAGSKPTLDTPTPLTSVFAFRSHTHQVYDSHGASHNEIWAAINSGVGGRGSGGVIDGTLCTDAASGEPCVSEIELHDGTNPNNQASYTYTVQHNCLLLIQLKNAIIADNESSSVPRDCILVKVGDNVVGTLTDNMQDLYNELDNDSLRIPVKAGSTVTLVGDGTIPIFVESSLTTNSKIVFSEFELTPLSMRIGLPNYDTPTDITDNVIETTLDTPRGYTAPADGFVLFRYNNTDGTRTIFARGYIGTTLVYTSGIVSLGTDADRYMSSCMVPVRKGDGIDFRTTNTNGTSLVSLTPGSGREFDVIFYPLAGADNTEGEGPIEYPVIECAFTDTESNPFIGNVVPSTDDLTITSAKLEALCGRSDIDLNTASISLKVDVFKPQTNGASVVLDTNGHAVVDKSYPLYRNEAIVYADADNSPAGYYNDYSRHLDVSIVNGSAKIAWTNAFAEAAASNNVRASFVLPALSTLVDGNIAQRAEWDDFNNRYGEYIENAATLGLAGYYIRLTAVIDPNTKIINQSKSGMFIDGQINVDDSGSECITHIEIDDGEANVSYKGRTWYKYTYIAKTDCFLYASFIVEASYTTGNEEVVLTLNGAELDAYSEVSHPGNDDGEVDKQLTMPVKKGTELCFYYSVKPINNRVSGVPTGILDTYASVIRIIEFKMSTELTPAKFPSLAVRICDVDCHEESTNANVLPADSTCEYFTWTESQMRQVFGSAFDFDHARFDVSAVFYVGNSVSDYDTAVNKLQDDGILISPTGQGQQVRPSVTIDTVNGERIAKLALPGIDYFCSTVKSDTTDGFKLVPRTDGAHISIGSSGNNLVSDFNTDYSKKVRMRLLLHVADRRSETSHMYASTPDWNADAIEIKAHYTNTNYTYIAEKDGYVFVGMRDPDNLITNGANSVGFAVEINGNHAGWIGVNKIPNSQESDSQDIHFPISAGDVVTLKEFNVGDTQDGRYYARMWFIPAKHTQLEVPDFNVPGSAGVIDGSVWKDSNGDPVGDVQACDNVKTVYTYNVKNDCMLNIVYNNSGIDRSVEPVVKVNGSEVCRFLMIGARASDRDQVMLPVAAGSVVTLTNDAGTAIFTYASSGTLTFTEFRLRATNVVAAMPDWSATGQSMTNNSIATEDGYLVFLVDDQTQMDADYYCKSYINGVEVFYWGWEQSSGDNNCQTTVVPICKGDKLTVKSWESALGPAAGQDGDISGRMTVKFYPVKMHEIKSEVVEEAIDVLSKVDEVTLVDAAADNDIFDAAHMLMGNNAIAPSTNDGTNDHPAGQFPVPAWTGYDTVVKFMKGVTEAELRTMTGNSLLSLRNADIEIKLVTYKLGDGGTFETVEQYEEIDPLVYVGNRNDGPRNIVSTIKPIISKVGNNRTIRVPWPSKFATNSTSHWSTDSSTFFPAQYGDLISLGSSIRARVVLVIKQRSSSSGS